MSRGVALYGDKVFVALGEAVLVALDAKTGQEVWRTIDRRQLDRRVHDGAAAGRRRQARRGYRRRRRRRTADSWPPTIPRRAASSGKRT